MSKKYQVSLAALLLILASVFVQSLSSRAVFALSLNEDYSGTWTGSYNNDNGGSGNLSFTFTRSADGQYGGSLRFTNQDGEQTAPFKSVQIADGKFTAKIESPDGKADITIQGTIHGNQMEGTYSVVVKESGEAVDGGKWSVTRAGSK